MQNIQDVQCAYNYKKLQYILYLFGIPILQITKICLCYIHKIVCLTSYIVIFYNFFIFFHLFNTYPFGMSYASDIVVNEQSEGELIFLNFTFWRILTFLLKITDGIYRCNFILLELITPRSLNQNYLIMQKLLFSMQCFNISRDFFSNKCNDKICEIHFFALLTFQTGILILLL